MNSKIEIDITLKIPVYKQLIQNIELLINNGAYQSGDLLPSMNELSSELEISKETVQKAYTKLKEKGTIEPSHGKGFFIAENKNQKTKILVLFDKISTYKQVLYSSFLASIGTNAEITIRLHNQDIALFEEFIEENLDKFDFYLITANFPLNQEIQKRVIKALKRIPNRKLLTLDRHITGLSGNYGSVYQDFESDAYVGLKQGIDLIRNYDKLNIIAMKGSLYAPLIIQGIKKFCDEFEVPYEILYGIKTDKIQKKEIFLILNSQLDYELIELVKAAKNLGLKIGSDIGIISYNESPINEIVLDGLTVISTDFKQMGELAARMVLDKSMKKVKCDFRLIRRNTL